ncbi:homing endonuclease associated repeat-containing protein [Halobaculum lipolyticum]|uniref:Homing endonuclease associated repeat-containing protein n=1 Tax=Halobaculum lipolyticum TaxID=3032001 RepID=A0ABD5WEI1_9EURY|nr:HNH endonuclease [Halobaculum sp. DT31]
MATKDDCLDALRTAADRLGESPSKGQYEDLDLTPSASTILRHCGGWNAAKEEAGLHTNTSTGSRTLPKPEDVELPEGLVWEELSQDQRWHYRNREWNTERTLRRRARLRSWVNDQKAESGCARCGESDAACLDLHHTEPDEKDRSVTRMITDGYGQERLEAELRKCIVLCANCHRKEHFTDPLRRFQDDTEHASR